MPDVGREGPDAGEGACSASSACARRDCSRAPRGLRLNGGAIESQRTGGGSDDIGDVSWVVPTITLNYPSNIPGLPGHHWANAISMATPIAHKGVIAGAKVQAMTMLDILLQPQLVKDAWDYFNNVETKDIEVQVVLLGRRTSRRST